MVTGWTVTITTVTTYVIETQLYVGLAWNKMYSFTNQ